MRGAGLGLFLTLGCSRGPSSPESSWKEQRASGRSSEDEAELGAWLAEELLAPGGSAKEAEIAARRLAKVGATSRRALLAQGLDYMVHGRPEAAAEAYFQMLLAESQRALDAEDAAEGRLMAWFAADKLLELSGHLRTFDEKHRAEVRRMLKSPGNIGFRAYSVLVELDARRLDPARELDLEARRARSLGCVREVRLLGPFGQGRPSDILRSFPPEESGAWALRYEPEKPGFEVAERYEAKVTGCEAAAENAPPSGVYYAESFAELEQAAEIIVATQGAVELWVDDVSVLKRYPSDWGSWPNYGSRVRLGPGRHRFIWKLPGPSTALRLLHVDGRPFPVHASRGMLDGYELGAMEVGKNPNELGRFIGKKGVLGVPDPLLRYVAASMADEDGAPEPATLLLDPLLKDPAQATGTVLATAAGFVESDPIFDVSQTRDLMHELYVSASERDPGLWYPRYASALWDAEQKGKVQAVTPLEELSKEFPEVATIDFSLASFYEELDWGPELEQVVKRVIMRFPEEPDALAYGVDMAEARGDSAQVDELLQRILAANPDTEVLLSRAIRRRDYAAARAELVRLKARRPHRKDIADRLNQLLEQSGDEAAVWHRLEDAVKREPRDAHARLALADAKYARGEVGVLSRALVETIQAGGDPTLIETAIELVEGLSVLEPFRLDALQVIREFEQKGVELPGTAARVLDYGAVLVRSDGSSQFLEHEVVRLQSEEAIRQFAEMDAGGNILHLRVLKKDGRILEPEAVRGKPTATMPHLEVGDYVEQERILSSWGDGVGAAYSGPTWYFREAGIAYARSEFVVVSPKGKALVIESSGGAPAPSVEEAGAFVARRFRVDDSPAFVSEPNSPAPAEFMPRVSVGWGLEFQERLSNLAANFVPLVPVDPRIVKIGERIVEGIPKSSLVARARALYHWVLENVQEGEQADGRQVVVSRNGNRARGFETLCQALDIPMNWVLAESRLASPFRGSLSAFERPLYPLLRVGKGKDEAYLTIEDRYSPFGTIPSHVRGERAYAMEGFHVQEGKVPLGGVADAITYRGTGELGPDGSAELSLEVIFQGRYAASLRNGLAEIPENQLDGVIESQLLGQFLEGARLKRYSVKERTNLDVPLVLEVETSVPRLATLAGGVLLLGPPFMPNLSQLTSLPQRKTPLLIGERVEQGVHLTLNLPSGFVGEVFPNQDKFGASSYRVSDKVLTTKSRMSVTLERVVVTDAGRIQPEDYSAFQTYTRSADNALSRAVRIRRRQ